MEWNGMEWNVMESVTIDDRILKEERWRRDKGKSQFLKVIRHSRVPPTGTIDHATRASPPRESSIIATHAFPHG